MNCRPTLYHHITRRFVRHIIRHKVAAHIIVGTTVCVGGTAGIVAILPPTLAPPVQYESPTPVPEPASVGVFVVGVVGMRLIRRKRA